MTALNKFAWLIGVAGLAAGCATATTTGSPAPAPRSDSGSTRAKTVALAPSQAERLKRIMVPLINAMNHKRQLSQVKVAVMDDPQINAANAGNGEFLVTRGLLEKADDEQLTAVLAHEVAHEDLGHVAKAQVLGAGLNIGMVILDQIFPGSGVLTPIAGTLVSRAYSRQEEYAADRHGVELLERTGKSKDVMINTLVWLMQTSGNDKSGFFATHPATDDRIDALRKLSSAR